MFAAECTLAIAFGCVAFIH